MKAAEREERGQGSLDAQLHPSGDRAAGAPMHGAVNGGLARPGGWTQSAPQHCTVQQGSGAPRPALLQPARPAQPAASQPASAPQPGHPGHLAPSARPPVGRAALPAWQQLPGSAPPAERARAVVPPAAFPSAAEPRQQAAAPAQPQRPQLTPVVTGGGNQPHSPTDAPGLWQLFAVCFMQVASAHRVDPRGHVRGASARIGRQMHRTSTQVHVTRSLTRASPHRPRCTGTQGHRTRRARSPACRAAPR